MRGQTLLPVLLLLLPAEAAAAADPEEGWCRNGGFPLENPSFGLASVAGAGRAYFLGDTNGCPASAGRCGGRAYVVAGDRVLIGRTRGRYTCAYYPSRGGGTAGWIETARLARLPSATRPPVAAWIGTWSDEGNPEVRFFVRRGALAVKGYASWQPADREAGPNTGDIAGALRVQGNRADEPECGVTFFLVGDFLVARDPDMRCGGANVSFTGVYRRIRG